MSNPEAVLKGLQLFSQGQALHAQKKYAEAADAYARALRLMPDHPKVLVAYGQLAEDVADWPNAERIYRKIGKLRPDSRYEGRLAAVLFKLEKFAEAIPLLEAHLAREPGDTNSVHALGNALCSTGRWEEGLAVLRRAVATREDPRYLDSEINALYQLGRTEELDARIAGVLARHPDDQAIRSLYALHKLKSGDYAEGFRFYADFRWRNNLKAPADGGVPGEWWDGKPFEGTLLVTAEQGLGDEIMASSMFEDLVAMGQRALIECDERLLPLFRRSFPALEFTTRRKGRLVERYQSGVGAPFRKLNAFDLAWHLRAGNDRFPARRAWLVPDAERVAAIRAEYRQRWPGKLLVGFSWKSARVMEGGGIKSMAIADLFPVLACANASFINLQYGDIAADLDALRAAGHALFVDENIDTMNDIDAFAAQVAALDLVVSSSNTTVHVAGGTGTPCWLMLPKTRPTLWYWGYRGEHTPWYPSLRLLRNPQEEHWAELVAQVAAEVSRREAPPG